MSADAVLHPIKKNNIVSEEELTTLFEQLTTQSSESDLNQYDLYIQQRQLEPSRVFASANKLPGFEVHHIIPRFDGGTNEKSNLVLLTTKEHVIAHWLRWKVLNKSQDYTAFLFRIGDTQEALAQRLKAVAVAREQDRVEGRFRFCSKYQRQMGLRGGSKGGSANTEKQFLARQNVGRIYGRQTGIKNQSLILKEFLTNYSLWSYRQEIFVFVSPKVAFIDVINILKKMVPNSRENYGKLYTVARGERPQAYGWRIVDMLTRSEVGEGINAFKANNPTAIVLFDEDFFGEDFFLDENLE